MANLTAYESRTAQRVRYGALAFVATGVISLVGLMLRGANEPASEDARTFAEAAADGIHHTGWIVLLFGPIIQIFAFLAIWGALRATRQERLAFCGAMLSVAGNALYLPSLGISAFVDYPVGKLYLSGNEGVVEVTRQSMFEGAGIQVLLLSATVLIAGIAVTCVAIWRSQILPKWSVVPYFLQVLCLTIAAQFAYPIELTGGVLLFVSSVWIGAAIWRLGDGSDRDAQVNVNTGGHVVPTAGVSATATAVT